MLVKGAPDLNYEWKHDNISDLFSSAEDDTIQRWTSSRKEFSGSFKFADFVSMVMGV